MNEKLSLVDKEYSKKTQFTNRLKSKKGIYLLPNLLTTIALFSGFYALLSSFHGNFKFAAIAIFIAMIFDGLDGRVARLTGTQSEFGVQFDSLSDMVCFGIAPAVLVYSCHLKGLGNLGWAIVFIYTACTAMRLARFNVSSNNDDDKSYFIGLPSPLAAATVASLVWFNQVYDVFDGVLLVGLVTIVTLIVALLMVSRVKYYSFKKFSLKDRMPFLGVLGMVFLIALIASNPPLVLVLVCLLYLSYAPVIYVYQRITKTSK